MNQYSKCQVDFCPVYAAVKIRGHILERVSTRKDCSVKPLGDCSQKLFPCMLGVYQLAVSASFISALPAYAREPALSEERPAYFKAQI